MKLNLKNELLRHSMVLFVSMMFVHVCNMGYQMVVSRMLPPSEYALLTSFLGVLLIVSRPMNVLSTGMNHYTRILEKQDRGGDVKRLLRKWLVLAGVPSIALAIVVIVASGQLAQIFHLERKAPVIVLALSLPVLFVLPVVTGTVQGLQCFNWSALASILRGVLRVGITAVALIWIYAASGWALVGHTGSMYAACFVLLAMLLFRLRGCSPGSKPLPSMKLYLAQSLVVLAGYTVLMTADVVLVNHYFPNETGFSYAATMGRLVASVAVAIGMAMFPKVVTSGAETEQHKRLFARSIGYSLFCTLPAFLVCFLIPRLLLLIVFGVKNAGDSMVLYLRMMALVMAFSSVLNIVVQYAVAQRRFKAVVPVVLSACIYFGVACWSHETIMQIIMTALFCNLTALGASLFLLVKRSS